MHSKAVTNNSIWVLGGGGISIDGMLLLTALCLLTFINVLACGVVSVVSASPPCANL